MFVTTIPFALAAGNVDVVGADPEVRDDPQPLAGRDHRRVDSVGEKADETLDVLDPQQKLIPPDRLGGVAHLDGMPRVAEARDLLREDAAREEDPSHEAPSSGRPGSRRGRARRTARSPPFRRALPASER